MEENNNQASLPQEEQQKDVVSGKIETQPDEEKDGISLSQIWFMLKKHFVAIIVMAFIGLAAGVVYARAIKKPSYSCSTQVMIVNTDTEEDETTNNISEARNKCLIAYGYMTSDDVANALAEKLHETDKENYDYTNKDESGNVIKDANGNVSYNIANVKKLYSVAISTVGSTSTTSIFITVTASASDEQLAIDVANDVSDITVTLCNTKGTKGYAYLKNSIASLGHVSTATDTSTSSITLALIGILGGLVIGCAYAVVRELLDTRVGSRYDLEMITGYKVIGMIPKYDAYVLNDGDKKEGEQENA